MPQTAAQQVITKLLNVLKWKSKDAKVEKEKEKNVCNKKQQQ